MTLFLNPHIYHAIAEARATWPNIPVYNQETYAQCAEDLIVCALLRRLAVHEGLDLTKARYLEIGGNHPISCSATWLLHRRFGMTGVIVEANPHLIGELQRLRPADRTLQAAVTPDASIDFVEIHIGSDDELSSLDRSFVETWPGWEERVVESIMTPAMTVNSLLETEFQEGAPLFMSIDIEGLDLAVLQSMDWALWRPAIITAEPSEHHLPGSTAALSQLFSDAGYLVIGATDVNLIAIDTARVGIDASGALAQTRREMADLARKRNAEQMAAAGEISHLKEVMAVQVDEIAQLRHEATLLTDDNHRLKQEAAVQVDEIAQLKHEATLRSGEIVQLQDKTAMRDHAYAQLQSELEHRESQLTDHLRLMTEAENRLNAFTASLTWRVALQLRKTVPPQLVRVARQVKRRVIRPYTPAQDVAFATAQDVVSAPSHNVALRPEWFDECYYRSQEPQLLDTSVDAFTHFATVGWRDGRDPHPLFDVRWYASQNADFASDAADPLQHFLAHVGPPGESAGWHPFSSGQHAARTHFPAPYATPGRMIFPSFNQADFLARLDAAHVFSLDIFDTALVRRVSPPITVFELMEVAARRIDARFQGLARQRVSAENKARELASTASGTMEIDFEAIYDVLTRELGLSDGERRQLQDIELDAERSALRANPEVLAWYNYAIQQGKKVIFVSDMYLSDTFLTEVLASVGFRSPVVYVSNKYGVGKWQTVLFERISAELDVAPHNIFHIGDNQQADCHCAQQAGWAAMHYVEGAMRQPYALQMRDGLTPDSTNLALSVGLGLAREHRLRLDAMAIEDEERTARQIGYEVVGPTVLAFAGWVAARAKTDRLDRVLFLARDGYLLQKVYEQLRQHGHKACESRYVLASRRLLYSRMFTSRESVQAAVEKIHFAPATSLAEYLDTFLLPDEFVKACAHKLGISDVHAPIMEQMRDQGDYPSIKAKIALAIEDMVPIILANARDQKSTLEQYYQEAAELDDDGRIGLVDLGWSGSIIHPIEDTLRATTDDISIASYFFGLIRNARNHLDPDMLVGAYFFRDCEWSRPDPLSPLSGRTTCDVISASPSLVEILISENTTTAINVRRDARSGEFTAIRADDSYEPRQRDFLEQVHRAALEFADDALTMLPLDPRQWRFQPLLSEVWKRVLSSPDEMEAKWLGAFRHRIDASGHAANATLVTNGNADVLASFQESLWPAGTLALMTPDDRAKVLNALETKR